MDGPKTNLLEQVSIFKTGAPMSVFQEQKQDGSNHKHSHHDNMRHAKASRRKLVSRLFISLLVKEQHAHEADKELLNWVNSHNAYVRTELLDKLSNKEEDPSFTGFAVSNGPVVLAVLESSLPI